MHPRFNNIQSKSTIWQPCKVTNESFYLLIRAMLKNTPLNFFIRLNEFYCKHDKLPNSFHVFLYDRTSHSSKRTFPVLLRVVEGSFSPTASSWPLLKSPTIINLTQLNLPSLEIHTTHVTCPVFSNTSLSFNLSKFYCIDIFHL